MLSMVLAYDENGDVIASLDYMVARDENGDSVGLIDFAAHEAAGGALTDVWTVEGAKGSKTWPEWLGAQAHQFRAELVGPAGNKQIGALVHKVSGHRRERAAVEAAIEATPVVDGARDIRRIVGGPDRPIILDENGRDAAPADRSSPKGLPVTSMSPSRRPSEVLP